MPVPDNLQRCAEIFSFDQRSKDQWPLLKEHTHAQAKP
jgi:hypothetical protein